MTQENWTLNTLDQLLTSYLRSLCIVCLTRGWGQPNPAGDQVKHNTQ